MEMEQAGIPVQIRPQIFLNAPDVALHTGAPDHPHHALGIVGRRRHHQIGRLCRHASAKHCRRHHGSRFGFTFGTHICLLL